MSKQRRTFSAGLRREAETLPLDQLQSAMPEAVEIVAPAPTDGR